MAASAGQARGQLGEALERHAPGLAREAHEPQAARRHHHDLGQLVARSISARAPGRQGHGPAGAAPARGGVQRAAGRRVVAGDLGQAGAEVGQRLVLAAGVRLDRAASHAERTSSSSVMPQRSAKVAPCD